MLSNKIQYILSKIQFYLLKYQIKLLLSVMIFPKYLSPLISEFSLLIQLITVSNLKSKMNIQREQTKSSYVRRQTQQSYDNKQNIPLKMNYPQSFHGHKRKYTYMDCSPLNTSLISEKSQNQKNINQNFIQNLSIDCHKMNKPLSRSISKVTDSEEIRIVKQQLERQRHKQKMFQQKTIKQQVQVLQQLSILEDKFREINQQKEYLQRQLTHLKDIHRQEKQLWSREYEDLNDEFKKVKGVGMALIDMRQKVEGIAIQDLHEAWKWVKSVVWEYQSIRKKALDWKKVYDQHKYKNK